MFPVGASSRNLQPQREDQPQERNLYTLEMKRKQGLIDAGEIVKAEVQRERERERASLR